MTNRIRAIAAAVLLLGSIPLALAAGKPIHAVDLNLSVTWDGKRGIQVPIRPGATETLKGACPPIIEVNPKFDPSDPIPVEARYSFSDGRTLERKQTTFMGGLYTESWEIPIHDEGQTFKGSVSLHLTSPASDQNDVTVPFSVACAPKGDPAATCDTTGNSCHAGVQLGTPVTQVVSPDLPPKTWSGGTLLPGTYVLTAMKQYTFKGTTVTADNTASEITVVLKKTGTGESAEVVVTQGACTQRETFAVAHDPKPIPGALDPAYEPVFNGRRAVMLTPTCPGGATMGMPGAYAVTENGFDVMILTGTRLTFVRKP